jgi:hypothetical protein
MASRLLASLIAGIVLLSAVAPAQAQGGPLVVELTGTGRGRATIGAGELTLELTGLRPGTQHVVHLHAGTVAQPSASFGLLGRFTADAQGRGQLRVTQAELSATGAPVDLNAAWLTDGTRLIDVHVGDGAVVASGVIPAVAGAPTQLPRTGSPPLGAVAAVALILTSAALLLKRSLR